jgi:hypothetical protein
MYAPCRVRSSWGRPGQLIARLWYLLNCTRHPKASRRSELLVSGSEVEFLGPGRGILLVEVPVGLSAVYEDKQEVNEIMDVPWR